MKTVITVHGISTTGKWQDEVGKLLACHFRHVPIRYVAYRRLGSLKLVSDPWVLSIGASAWAIMLAFGINTDIFGALAGLLLGGFAGALIRRRMTFLKVKKQMEPYMMHGQTPHLVAHSFGTYLAGRMLHFTETEFDVIILTGSVLPRRFWSNLKLASSRGPEDRPYNRVRNERCLKDRIAQAAVLLYGFIPGMGHSGYAGFAEEVGLVHDAENAWTVCSKCAVLPAPVHNVVHRELGHSDLFIGRLHAVRIWLPVLWGIEPKEYDLFIKLCRLAASYQAETDYLRLAQIETLLAQKKWNLTGGATIPEYLVRHIEARCRRLRSTAPQHIDDLSSMGVALVWQVVEEAASAALYAAEPTRDAVKALLPTTALIRAAEAVC
jgi:hypothetical protein